MRKLKAIHSTKGNLVLVNAELWLSKTYYVDLIAVLQKEYDDARRKHRTLRRRSWQRWSNSRRQIFRNQKVQEL